MTEAAGQENNNEMASQDEGGKDILVVVSKLKAYIRAKSGMNTAANVAPKLTKILQKLCDEAIERANSDHRKTVMERDFV